MLIYKRLEAGKFCFKFTKEHGLMAIDIKELGWLLAGLEWQKMRHWKELSYDKFG